MPLILALALLGQSGGYARPDLLVDTAWLASHLDDPAIRIVDMRRQGYDEAHVPGAVLLANEAIRVADRPPTFLPTPAEFEALMHRLGIGNDTRVIAYDDRGGIYATRLWWILNYFGHTNVAVLDGGWTAWTADGRPTNAAAAPARDVTFTVRPGTVKVATAAEVMAAIGRPGTTIVDARTQAEIDGQDLRGIRRGGFIESSVPVYWEDFLDPVRKTFRSAAEISKIYRDRGVMPGDEVITYCQIGMRASHDLFALALIGHDLAKLHNYYGSWEEWGNRDDTPIKRKQ
ncbi:MAG: sulfurtransferase [Vicinamibacterales bacterium]